MSATIGVIGLTLIGVGAVGVLVFILGFLVSTVLSFVIAVVEDIRRHFGGGLPETNGLGKPVLHN